MSNKSIVGCFVGGRGSGKTLSMSVEGTLALISGKTVWSNYPVEAGYRNDDGTITWYKSNPLQVGMLITQDPCLLDSLVLMDEMNLWSNSRRSQTNINNMINSLFQLIRKRALSFYVTTQDFHWLDVRIRFQVDLLIRCFDMSYRYHNLEQGTLISQEVTDMSGVYCGRPLFKNDDVDAWFRNTRTRILHGKGFWNTYNTLQEFDIEDALAKYSIKRPERIISFGDNKGVTVDSFTRKIQDRLAQLQSEHPEGFRVPKDDMREIFDECGMDKLSDKKMGTLIKSFGMTYGQGRKGGFYKWET